MPAVSLTVNLVAVVAGRHQDEPGEATPTWAPTSWGLGQLVLHGCSLGERSSSKRCPVGITSQRCTGWCERSAGRGRGGTVCGPRDEQARRRPRPGMLPLIPGRALRPWFGTPRGCSGSWLTTMGMRRADPCTRWDLPPARPGMRAGRWSEGTSAAPRDDNYSAAKRDP